MTDHDTDVRGWLQGAASAADALPSSFGATTAIQRARTRHRTHVAMTATAALAAVALVAVPAVNGWPWTHSAKPGQGTAGTSATSGGWAGRTTTCRSVDLPVPGGLAARGVTQPTRTFVTAMDPGGAYVAADALDANNNAAAVILWHNGAPTVLPTSGLGTISQVAAVNSNGVAAGTGEDASAVGFAWVYRGGVVTKLPNVAGYSRLVRVYAVNEAGDVLGSALSTTGDHSIVVIWPASSPDHPQVQAPLSDVLGTQIGAAFDDNQQLYAWSQSATRPAVRTADGRERALALPNGFVRGGVTGIRGSWAFGVAFKTVAPAKTASTSGKPAGTADDAPVPVRWRLDTGAPEVIAARGADQVDDLMPAFAITPVNQPGPKPDFQAPGYLALGGGANGRVFLLPAGEDQAVPVAVNDSGSLVAGSISSATAPHTNAALDLNTRAVLWHC